MRVTAGERWPAARSVDSVWIEGQLIRVKVSAGRVKAEHDDVALAARRTGMSLREMAYRAEAVWRTSHDGPRIATPQGTTSGRRGEPGDPSGPGDAVPATAWEAADRLSSVAEPPTMTATTRHRTPRQSHLR